MNSFTKEQIIIKRDEIIAQAAEKHKQYKQYKGHWDKWEPVIMLKRIITKGGLMVHCGEFTIAAPKTSTKVFSNTPAGETTIYSPRKNWNVGVEEAEVLRLGITQDFVASNNAKSLKDLRNAQRNLKRNVQQALDRYLKEMEDSVKHNGSLGHIGNQFDFGTYLQETMFE